nr:uncharacterized protein LOC116778261 [Danaus plexippus plexippus]
MVQVLGRFVDKLHDAEMYPKFLDDMLDSVGGLVNDLYESSVDGDLMLEVDEKIQRIFLLNRSHHIMRYTIELITGKLEKLHTKLCDSIEITQTATTENLCYMLHILEILLRRYTAIDNVSQSSVDSQGSVLRKNSLTDIWRRKWNLSDSDVRVSEKTCILTECRRVLNKILLLTSHQRSVWSGVVLVEHYILPVGQFWTLLDDRLLETVQLLAVDGRIERLAIWEQLIVDDSLPTPPNTQQNLPGR